MPLIDCVAHQQIAFPADPNDVIWPLNIEIAG
jgi:hypothetical protein